MTNRKFTPIWVRVLLLAIIFATATGWLSICPLQASARVIQEHLQDGRILDKSFRTVTDSNGYSWQLIAFTTTQHGTSDGPYLRMVGFPGAVSVDRSHPMVVSIPTGEIMMLDDVSFLIFKEGLPSQENVAQYDLGQVLEKLPSPTSLRLSIPVFSTVDSSSNPSQKSAQDIEQLELRVSQSIVDEWLTVSR